MKQGSDSGRVSGNVIVCDGWGAFWGRPPRPRPSQFARACVDAKMVRTHHRVKKKFKEAALDKKRHLDHFALDTVGFRAGWDEPVG